MARDAVSEIKSRVDIVDVISRYVPLKQSGARFKGLCPFHEEKTPSFTVHREHQMFKCFGCGLGGDVFTFLMQIENLPFVEAARRLGDMVGVPFEARGGTRNASRREALLHALSAAADFYEKVLWESPQGRKARQYVQDRGLTEETARLYRLGYAPPGWDSTTAEMRRLRIAPEVAVEAGLIVRRQRTAGYYDRFRDRLMFPIRDVSGSLVAFGGRTLAGEDAKYINSPESSVFVKGRTLYGLYEATRAIGEAGSAVVTEGYMDVLALHQHGIRNAVATMGTAVTERTARLIKRYTETVHACFDADSAGLNALLRAAPLFEQAGVHVRIVTLPADDDPDSFVRSRGAEAWRELAATAPDIIDYRLALVAAEHGIDSGGAVTADFVRAVVAILTDVASPVEREQRLINVAQRWSGGDADRVRAAEMALRQEMRMHRSRQRSRRMSTPEERPALQRRPSSAAALGESGPVRAERELLSAMLRDPHLVPTLRSRLDLDLFADAIDAEIAAAIYACADSGDAVTVEAVSELVTTTEATRVLSGLALAEDGPSSSGDLIAELLGRVEDHARRRELDALEERVQRELSAGTLSRHDPNYLRYLELQRYFREGNSSSVANAG